VRITILGVVLSKELCSLPGSSNFCNSRGERVLGFFYQAQDT
jgi:hypothetical protein